MESGIGIVGDEGMVVKRRWWHQTPQLRRKYRSSPTKVLAVVSARKTKKRWSKKIFDVINDVIFRIVSIFEAIFLVAILLFFFIRFGFQV